MLGVLYHWIGGLAAASFYIPYRGVRRWSWETYWLVGGIFSWIVAPWLSAWLLVPDLRATLSSAPASTLAWAYVFGVLWGLGGLTFGLTMRYLGIALGVAVALGFCAAFGTLIPPIVAGEFGAIAASTSGRVILCGVAVCLLGIALSGLAGRSKERELSSEQKAETIREFDFRKGMLVAIFCGVMSACFAYGLAAGKPLADLTRARLLEHGRADLWQNLPVLVVVLLGGFTTNVVWCVILNAKNRSAGEYPGDRRRPRPSAAQLPALRRRRGRLVPAVLLLQHGANAHGLIRILQLDDAHGEHHHFQHAVGRGASRVEGDEPANPHADCLRPRRAGGVDAARGLR